MKLGLIGAGKIGGTLGVLWALAGHTVRFGTRHPGELGKLLERTGKAATAGTPEQAAAFGDVVFCSVPYGAWPDLAPHVLRQLDGKVVLDSANPYPERDGAFAERAIEAGQGSGVPVAQLLPGIRLVRAFNSVYYETLESQAHRASDRIGIPLASDDETAFEVAAGLVRDAGFDPVIVGRLRRAREFDPGRPVFDTDMSGVALAKALGVPHHASRVL